MDRILERFGHVQEEYEHLRGYAIERRARSMDSASRTSASTATSARSRAAGRCASRWHARSRPARRPAHGRADVHLDIESILWLESYSKPHRRAAHDLARPRVHEPRRLEIAEIDGGEITYSGNYDFYERERAIRETIARPLRGSRRCSRKNSASSTASPRTAKAAQVQSRVRRSRRSKDRAAQEAQIVAFDFQAPSRSGDKVAVLEGV